MSHQASWLYVDFGVNGVALAWIVSYLSDHEQYVKVSRHSSTTKAGLGDASRPSTLCSLRLSSRCYQINRTKTLSVCKWYSTLFHIEVGALKGRFENHWTVNVGSPWLVPHQWSAQPNKVKVIALGTAIHCRTTISVSTVTVAYAQLSFVDNIWSLGVQIDSDLLFDAQVKTVCKSCNYHIWALRQIRNNLLIYTAKTVACAIVDSHIDYCNSLLYNISEKKKLRRVQNSLTRVVMKAPRLTPTYPLLLALHRFTCGVLDIV